MCVLFQGLLSVPVLVRPPKAWKAMEAELLHEVLALGAPPPSALLPHLTPPVFPVPQTPGPLGKGRTIVPAIEGG